jgi:predicted RNA-binding Zn-ribbon protein involved in translation (DUF1610 family)
MTITIGGLGDQISFPCPKCSVNMIHMAVATLGTGRTLHYEYQCKSCELSVKADRLGNSKLLKEMENA